MRCLATLHRYSYELRVVKIQSSHLILIWLFSSKGCAFEEREEVIMSYTVQEVAEITGMSPHTIRYYDRKGLMPCLKKDEHGNRIFEKSDLQWIDVLRCVKISCFTISEMHEYADLVRRGDSTLEDRLQMFENKRQHALEALAKIQRSLDHIEYKCWYYQKAIEAGTEKIHFTEDGYDQPLCFQRYREWKEHQSV